MTLVYLRTDLFLSPARTLVNAVNTVGVMGKGLAKSFKQRYPDMYREYRALCDRGALKPGKLHLWRGPDKWVLNFPTKTTWRRPSELEYLKAGLERFVARYERLGIESISFPPLGCGNGNLDWEVVKPVMEKHLRRVKIPVYLHDRQVSSGFVPRHDEATAKAPPYLFVELMADLRVLVQRTDPFRTLGQGSPFRAEMTKEGHLRIRRDGSSEIIPREEIEMSWAVLHRGLLTADQFTQNIARRSKSYLFSILACLPYVQAAEVGRVHSVDRAPTVGYGLFLLPRQRESPAVLLEKQEQLRLWV